ncbi:MAG: hypothetical protein R3331_11640 [Sulfurospirillaceae bacterium]|nr:hypothetical protein [Sulfurospirillaceae bacterium]
MKKAVIILFFMSVICLAYDKVNIINDYQNKNYKNVCMNSLNLVYTITDEDMLSLIADACLRIDYINPLGDIIKKLYSTPKYRENASYFATILLQKKLIYQFMNDGIDISDIRLPRTSYILSVVFENLVKKNYKIVNNKIEIDLGVKKYLIWLSNDEKPKVFIQEYKNNKLIKQHWYL